MLWGGGGGGVGRRYHKTPGSGQIENFDLATSRSFVATLPVHLFQSKYKICIIQLSQLCLARTVWSDVVILRPARFGPFR